MGSVLGLIFGSFATAAAYRIPRRESLVTGRSHCPNCDATITAIENVPVFSYVFLRGRCRHCGEPISARYPLIELCVGALFGLTFWKFGLSVTAVAYAAFFWVLVVLAVIDFQYHRLPDVIVFPAFIVGLLLLLLDAVIRSTRLDFDLSSVVAIGVCLVLNFIYRPWQSFRRQRIPEEDPSEDDGPRLFAFLIGLLGFVSFFVVLIFGLVEGKIHLLGGLEGAAVFSTVLFSTGYMYFGLRGRYGMGGGDVKLALLLGLFVGYLGGVGLTLVATFLSFFAGAFLGLFIGLITGKGGKARIPFGPFLSVGATTAIFLGETLLRAYLSTAA